MEHQREDRPFKMAGSLSPHCQHDPSSESRRRGVGDRLPRRFNVVSTSSLFFLVAITLLSSCVTVAGAVDLSVTPPLCSPAMAGHCNCTQHKDGTIASVACEGIGLTAIPDLRWFPNLTQLCLLDNNISVIRASDFDPCRDRLFLLDLNSNQLQEIEEGAFRDMPDLREIYLADNLLTSIPDEIFSNKTKIEILDVAYNQLTRIPAGFKTVESYVQVKFDHNPLVELLRGDFWGFGENGLKSITSLDLSSTGLTSLKPGLLGLPRITIERLYLNGNYFPLLNDTFFNGIQELSELGLRNCSIQVIKRGTFASLDLLSNLWLDGNNLTLLRRGPFEHLTLLTLDLSNSNISDIRRTAFSDLQVQNLIMKHNNIQIIGNREFEGLEKVTYLDLTNCGISEIKGTPFDELHDLERLILLNNNLTDSGLGKGLQSHPSLQSITLSGNYLTRLPNFAVDRFPRMFRIYASHNEIAQLSREDMANVSYLVTLNLRSNPLEGFPPEDDTFADCGLLEYLFLDHTHLTRLPNLTHMPMLSELLVSHARLEELPEDICCSCSRLTILDVEDNGLTHLPTMSCSKMVLLNVGHNRLITLHGDLLKGMRHVNRLSLQENFISELSDDFFVNSRDMEYLRLGSNNLQALPDLSGMPHLVSLNASHNSLRRLRDRALSEQVRMDFLYLNDNDLESIGADTFPVNCDLKLLNLSRNPRLRELPVPPGGFELLAELYLEENRALHQVPHPKNLPRVRELYLTYSYHCCIFEDSPGLALENDTEIPYEEGGGSGDGDERVEPIVTHPTDPAPTTPEFLPNINCPRSQATVDFWAKIYQGILIYVEYPDCDCTLRKCWDLIDVVNHTALDLPSDPVEAEIYLQELRMFIFSSRSNLDFTTVYRQRVICTPHGNPLTPCTFLLDTYVLKIAIWAVWVLALLGNGTVLFIGIATRDKLESSELLICNLAFADFCMGVYLAFLAIVDVRTFGSSYYQSALDWQLGAGCKAAGFIAIFSSELSIYILVVLTLERVYSLSNIFNPNDKRRKRVVVSLCVAGWVVAALLALLPIIGVNSYDQVAVCLPYLTENLLDKFYIGAILTLNFVGFLVILFSYAYIFLVVCKNAPPTNAAQRRKDMLIAAAKIAVVIVTAFFCWAPIAVVGYLALGGIHLVDAQEAKYFIVFVYPLNACVNPFIYAIFTKRFRSKLGSIFLRRSKGRVTSFPASHHMMRLQRMHSAFTSDYQGVGTNSGGGVPGGGSSGLGGSSIKGSCSSPTSRQEELTRLRQSRRSSSLVVQMVNTNSSLSTPSPTFNPPLGCNLGRRASLPPGFGSTLNSLNMAGVHDSSNPNLPHYSIVPFRLGSVYSSNNSSLPNLQEESPMDLENDVKEDAVFGGGGCDSGGSGNSASSGGSGGGDRDSNPLTSSQESNFRRLSVVREEEEKDDGGGGASSSVASAAATVASSSAVSVVGGVEGGASTTPQGSDGEGDDIDDENEEDEDEDVFSSCSSSDEYTDASSDSLGSGRLHRHGDVGTDLDCAILRDRGGGGASAVGMETVVVDTIVTETNGTTTPSCCGDESEEPQTTPPPRCCHAPTLHPSSESNNNNNSNNNNSSVAMLPGETSHDHTQTHHNKNPLILNFNASPRHCTQSPPLQQQQQQQQQHPNPTHHSSHAHQQQPQQQQCIPSHLLPSQDTSHEDASLKQQTESLSSTTQSLESARETAV